MIKIYDSVIEHVHDIALKWHLAMGFILGSGPLAFLLDRWQDVLFAFILGLVTAFGTGLGKLLIDRLFQRKKKSKLVE
jgi:hypothetical protein